MDKELTSQSDYAKEGLRFYRKNQNSRNTFALSLGVNVIEMHLKAIIEQEIGYVPKELKGHSLLILCSTINRMNIPGFQIPYSFQKDCQLLQPYYTGGRYFDENCRRNNIYTDYEFNLVSKSVDKIEVLLKEYKMAQEKNLNALLAENRYF